MPIDKFGNILGQDTIKKIYEDTASESMQEVSKIGVDTIKALRLFTAPIQLAAAYQDRLSKYLDKVRAGVKEENQIESPAFISGPILEKLRYAESDNPLTELFLNLLQSSIDKTKIEQAHPAFFHIINQLSADEAYILFYLSKNTISITYTLDLYYVNEAPFFNNQKFIKNSIPPEKILYFNLFSTYVQHLVSLGMVSWPVDTTEYIYDSNKIQTGILKNTIVELTDFGMMFVKACIPNGLDNIK